MAAFTYSTQVMMMMMITLIMMMIYSQGTAEKKTAAKLEKLRKENPEEVENLLKTVYVPTQGPPNRYQ